MQFTPKSEEELQALNLLEPGEYDFEIIKAEDRRSKSGNEMIALTIKVWDHAGKERTVFDWLLDSELSHYKIKHFCFSVGLEDKYELGLLESNDCWGRKGILKLGIQKDKTKQYPDKNVVNDYIVDKESKSSEEFKDDDIPF